MCKQSAHTRQTRGPKMAQKRRIQRRHNMFTLITRCASKPYTMAELATKAGITRPAIEAVITDLTTLEWLEPTDAPSQHTIGRPATYFRLKPSTTSILALDIGAHHISAMHATYSGEILAEDSVPIDEQAPASQRLHVATRLAQNLATHSYKPLVCAVASRGVIDNNTVAYFGGRGMPGWQGLNLADSLGPSLNTRVISLGDCALGARGESWKGAAANVNDVLYILAGQRTGAASVIDGRIHAGYGGSAGLIGELPELRWREIEEETFSSALYPDGQPARDTLFSLAKSGDTTALRAVQEYADLLTLGIDAMILATAPECVVIGGRFASHADLFLPRLIERCAQVCPFPPTITVSTLGGREVILGAIRYAMDAVTDRLSELIRNSDRFPHASPDSLWEKSN